MGKFAAGLLLFAAYVFVGCVLIGILADGFKVITPTTEMTVAEFMGTIVLWPLFFIKYLAIGIWMMLSSGFALL